MLKMTDKTFVTSAERIWAFPVGRRKVCMKCIGIILGLRGIVC